MEWLVFAAPVLALVLGTAIGWSTRAGIDRRDESAALNALIMDLHLKHSLAAIEPHSTLGPTDGARLRSTILDARARMVETLAHLRSGSPSTEVLMRMSAACTRYLRDAARTPEHYQFALMELRGTLVDGVLLLSDGRRRVRFLAPGGRLTATATTAKPGKRR